MTAEQQKVGDPADAAELAAFRRGPRASLERGLVLFALLAGVACTVLSHRDSIDAWLRGEIELGGAPRYVPPFEVDPDRSAAIDHERLHSSTIPRWIAAVAAPDTPASRGRAELAFRELRSELAPDPNLLAIWDELHARMPAAAQYARRIDWLLWAHDAYLDIVGEPFRLEASMHVAGERVVLSVRSYRVLADRRARSGARVRVLRRIDASPLVEGWLGRTSRGDDGALVVADRVIHFAARHVWPALRPALDARRPGAEQGLLEGVRREARQALSPRSYAVLEETAEDQQVLVEVAESIRARHACGSRLAVLELPYLGLSTPALRSLVGAVRRSQGSSCPEITLDEAAQLVGASERLRTTPDLVPALEELAAFVAHGVAVHELRHVEDGPSAGVLCPGCEPGMPDPVRAELSAYLSAFSTPGVGYVSALQACALPDRTTGLDAVAITIATGASIDGGCGAEAADLYDRAASAERRFFGVRPTVGAPPNLPAALDLFPHPPVAVACR